MCGRGCILEMFKVCGRGFVEERVCIEGFTCATIYAISFYGEGVCGSSPSGTVAFCPSKPVARI